MTQKMKTLLIYPRFGWEWDIMHPDMPMGIAYIASMLRDHAKEVKIHDMSFDKSFDELKKILTEYKPDVVGIEVLSINVDHAFKIAELVKNSNKNSKVIVGGPHPTFQSDEMLKNKNIDIAVKGEAEYTFVELIDNLEKNKSLETIKGIVFKEGKKLKTTSPREPIHDLDLLPFPAVDLLPHENYFSQPSIEPMPAPGINIVTSRGCPFDCNFCQPISKKLFGLKHRKRSPKNIVDELRILKNKYPIKSFSIVDDLFVMEEDYVKEFCQELIKAKLNLKWRCNSRVNTITYEKLKAMKKSGCISIIFGVESGSQRMLDLMKKNITVKQTKNTFKLCKKAKISSMANILLGYPGETKESLEETIELIKEIKPEMLSVNLASPMPGTRLYDMVKKEGKLNVKQYAEFNREFPDGIKLDNLTNADLVYYKKKAYSAFYKTIFPRFFIYPYFIKNLFYRILTLPMKERIKVIKGYSFALIKGDEHKRR